MNRGLENRCGRTSITAALSPRRGCSGAKPTLTGMPVRMGALLVLLAAALPAFGQSDDFNSGSAPAWTPYDPIGSLPGDSPATYSFPNGGYEITAPPSANSAYGPARAGSLREDVTYAAKFSVAIDFIAFAASQSDEAAGVLARISNVGLGTTDGYAFTYGTGGRDIDINRITNEQPALLARTQITLDPSSLGPNQHYRIVFTGDGPLLTGTVYLVNVSNEADYSDPLASISATDGTYNSGYSGLLTFDNTDTSQGSVGADATFDNYAASVPEPAAGTLTAGAALLVCRRRRGNGGKIVTQSPSG